MGLRAWIARLREREMGPTSLVVGLGNPGAEYEKSRHNVGFWCVERLAEKHRLRFNTKRAQSVVARGRVSGEDVALAKPQTYMNLSGAAVKQLVVGWGLPVRNVLIVYDDVDLPLASIRMRERGGPGTHNGMRSIVQSLGATDFPRLRIGIGTPTSNQRLSDHVLGNASSEERAALDEAVGRAIEAIELFVRQGAAMAMNRYNG